MVNSTPWMTRREAAAYARVTEQTIDAWRKTGLPSSKGRRRVLIDRRDLERFLRAQPQFWEAYELVDQEGQQPAA